MRARPASGPSRHGHRHGAVERDHRRGGHRRRGGRRARRSRPSPSSRPSLDVAGGDGRLDLERPGRPSRRAAARRSWPSAMAAASNSERSCSARTTRSPASSTRAALPGVVEQHQRQQAERLGLVGHQRAQDPTQADGLARQAAPDQVRPGAGRVPLVEEQVEHRQHGRRALHELVRPAAPRTGCPAWRILRLARTRRCAMVGLGHQEGPGDLRRRHAGQRAQGERHLGLEGQRRVATGEHQAQAVVGHLAPSSRLRVPRLHGGYLRSLAAPTAGRAAHGRWRGCVPPW